MINTFNSIRDGDSLIFNGVHYTASGLISFFDLDGNSWKEWMFIPKNFNTNIRLTKEAKWLCYDDDLGLTIWSTLSNIKIKGNARNYILNGVNYRLLETGTAEWNEDAESYFLGR
ncbi:DUF4178 domain-containing protein, partial [Leptospira sp. 96542]|nr:DUF4178 domain-containing protein [Leptospira sp. 96542]